LVGSAPGPREPRDPGFDCRTAPETLLASSEEAHASGTFRGRRGWPSCHRRPNRPAKNNKLKFVKKSIGVGCSKLNLKNTQMIVHSKW
jgi:hypothetical protein